MHAMYLSIICKYLNDPSFEQSYQIFGRFYYDDISQVFFPRQKGLCWDLNTVDFTYVISWLFIDFKYGLYLLTIFLWFIEEPPHRATYLLCELINI